MFAFIIIITVATSFLTSLWFIKMKDRMRLTDVPNIRSSHVAPMPKGGGIGIVVGVFVSLALCYTLNMIDIEIKYLAIIMGFFAMALLGFCSDRFNISSILRFLSQIFIAIIVLYFIKPPALPETGGYSVSLGYLGALFAIIWLAGITNFYNFMDGIDGLAAMQGVISGIGIAILGMILKEKSLIPMGLVLSGAIGGFLLLNFPPAKIFMGDTGSYAIGFYIASLALVDKRLPIPISIILGVFIFDTVVTLIRRIIKNEEWFKAHRNHFYQRALKLGYSHLEVTSVLSVISILLTAMACIYLKVSAPFQIGIIVATFFILAGSAILIMFKEKRRGRTNVIHKT